jgi:hypothetical protein
MRRPIVIALLSFGAIAGFGSGFAHLHRYGGRCGGYSDWRDWEGPTVVTVPAPTVAPQVNVAAPTATAAPVPVSPTTVYVAPTFMPPQPQAYPPPYPQAYPVYVVPAPQAAPQAPAPGK